MQLSTTSLEQFFLIEKEDIMNTNFPKDEVLNDSESVRNRARKIHRATSLGNIQNHKVNILFLDEGNEKKRVFTTIWAQTPKKVVLKKGDTIPVHSIVDILE